MRPGNVRTGMQVRLTADTAAAYNVEPETVFWVSEIYPRPGYKTPWIELEWVEPSFSVFGQVKPSELRPALSAEWTKPTTNEGTDHEGDQ